MSLSNMQVFSEYLQTTMTEVLDQEVQKFNAASNGAIVLQSSAHEGDFSDMALYAKIPGLVRRRDAYGSGAVTPVGIQQLLDTSVKVAAGTPPVKMTNVQFTWIKKSPEEAGVVIGTQLAQDTLADMLNTALNSWRAATKDIADLYTDVSGGATASLGGLNTAKSKMGDRAQSIAAWIMHSKPMFDIYGENLANASRLFQFGTVNIFDDGFGVPMIVTDSDSLITVPVSANRYHSAGLVPGAIMVGQNNDFDEVWEEETGDENIQRTYQAEWTYNLGMKGFAWDKGAGGASPDDTALGTGTNWNQYATSLKDLTGVHFASD